MERSVVGGVRIILRLEGLCAVLAACLAYQHADYSWGKFFLFFFVPDFSFAAYLAGPRIGAVAYNAAHTYVTSVALGICFYFLNDSAFFSYVLIWIAHIGFDRAMGYGLKYASGFSDTHLGRVGKAKP